MKQIDSKLSCLVSLLVILLLLEGKLIAQPVAGFTSSPVSGCFPLKVDFTDMSTGNPTSWKWNLGNNSTSTQQNPTTTYFNPGVYTVSLTVTNSSGTNTITKTQYITVYLKPDVIFFADDTTGCAPSTIKFTDYSTPGSGSITLREWDFGDGNTSTLQNPEHTYAVPGNYSVTLRVTNSNGCNKLVTKSKYINIPQAIQAGFTNSTPVQCKAPETISFNNSSTGPAVISYLWNFGDGGTSTLASPSHTYKSGGKYTVSLIAQSTAGCIDTLVKENVLSIKQIANTITGPDSVCIGSTAQFTNTSVPQAITTIWSFADTTITGAEATKSWSIAGSYAVKLVNYYDNCTDTINKNIIVNPKPFANFQADDSTGCANPMTVNFTDLSVGAVSWLWNFGDYGNGGSSTLQNPTYVYNNSGQATVKLTITNSTGCSNTFIKDRYIKVANPSIKINATAGGCIPFTFKPTANISSFDGVQSYLWDFGDGNTSTLAAPENIYPAIGDYNVTLTITSKDGCTVSDKLKVEAGTLPSVDFTSSSSAVCGGADVQFTDKSVPADRWQWNFGDGKTSTEQNPVHAYMDTGYFAVTLTAWNNGCSTTVKKNQLLNIFPSVSKFTPVYDCVNKLHVSFKDNSILPLSWLWDFGDGQTSTQQNPEHIYTSLGTYVVSLTTTNGSCTHTLKDSIKLIDERPTTFKRSTDSSVCINTVITFTATGINAANIATYQWTWGDGQTDTVTKPVTVHRYTNVGNNTVKLVNTDIHGCSDSSEIPNYVHVYGPVAGLTASAMAACKGSVINFTDASTPDPLYPILKWVWNYDDGYTDSTTINNGFNHTFNKAGHFDVSLTVTDGQGCSDSAVLSTPLYITDPIASFVSDNMLTCIGSDVHFTNISAGDTLSYTWDLGNGITSNEKEPVTSYPADGNYTVKLSIADINGCRDSIQLTDYVRVNTVKASFVASDSASTCNPFEVKFTNTSVNSISQEWEFGDGNTSTVFNPTYYYTEPGTYTIKLKAMSYGGCVDSFSYNVRQLRSDVTVTYTPLKNCTAMNVDLKVNTNGQFKYLWDFGDGNAVETTMPTTSHQYVSAGDFVPKVIMSDATGCQVPIEGVDTIKLTPIVFDFAATDTTICSGTSTQFKVLPGAGADIAGYNWSFNTESSSTAIAPTQLYTAPGNYTVALIARTSYGCTDTLIKENYINVAASPKATIIGDTTSCGATTFSFKGNLLEPDTAALTWQWNFGNSSPVIASSPAEQNYYASVDFKVKLTVTNSNGCSQVTEKNVIVHPLPTLNAGRDTIICMGQPAYLHVNGYGTNYQWSPSANLDCSNCASTVSHATASTMYTVKATTEYGCEKEDSVFVKVNGPFAFTATAAKTAFCSGESVQLNASGAEVYSWLPDSSVSNAHKADPMAFPTSNTIYTVTGSDKQGCFIYTQQIPVTVFKNPVVNAGADQQVQFGNTVSVPCTYSNDVINWQWTPSTGLSCSNCANPSATLQSSATYIVKVTNRDGCTATDKVTLNVPCDANNVFIPNTFSPNGDGRNDVFYPMGKGIFRIQSFTILNRWGQTMYSRTNFAANDERYGWNGTFNGKRATPDVYTYIIQIVCSDNSVTGLNGNVTLVQ